MLMPALLLAQGKLTVSEISGDRSFKVKPRKIESIQLFNGHAYFGSFSLDRTGIITEEGLIPFQSIRNVEIRKTKFGDVVSFPFRLAGLGSGGMGTLMLAVSGDEEEDSDLEVALVGIGFLGASFVFFKFSNLIEPRREKRLYDYSSKEFRYSVGRK